MWYQLKSYFFFLLKSTNQHGIHSPFVYKFITECVYNKSKYYSYNTLKNIRKQLLQNNNTITITDFGEGSRVFKSNDRKVSSIAKNAGVPYKRQKLLFRIAGYFKSEEFAFARWYLDLTFWLLTFIFIVQLLRQIGRGFLYDFIIRFFYCKS